MTLGLARLYGVPICCTDAVTDAEDEDDGHGQEPGVRGVRGWTHIDSVVRPTIRLTGHASRLHTLCLERHITG